MEVAFCPNFSDCRLVNQEHLITDMIKKENYINSYCKKTGGWELCKRYISKNELGLCPDFLFPDTQLSLDEILDKFEKEINNTNK